MVSTVHQALRWSLPCLVLSLRSEPLPPSPPLCPSFTRPRAWRCISALAEAWARSARADWPGLRCVAQAYGITPLRGIL